MVVALSAGADGQHPALHQRQAQARGPELPASAAGADPGRDQRRHHLPGTGDGDRQAAGRLHAGRCRSPAPRHGQEDQGRDGRPARGVRRRARSSAGSTPSSPTRSSTRWPSSRPTASTRAMPPPTRCSPTRPAWLKANHPVEFFAAAMTTECANQEKLAAYRQEMRQRGIPLYPPDVNHSKARFLVEDGTARRRRPLRAGGDQGRRVRPPRTQLVEEREASGPFRDVARPDGAAGHQGAQQAPAGKPGPRRRPRLRWSPTGGGWSRAQTRSCAMRAAAAEAAESDQVSLFGGSGVGAGAAASAAGRRGLAGAGAAADGVRRAGPLPLGPSARRLPRALERLGVTTGDRLRAGRGRRAAGCELAGVVASKQERVTERTRLVRLIVSDPTAQFEITAFSELMGQARELLDGSCTALFRGRRPRRRRQSAADRPAHPKTRRGRRPGARRGRDHAWRRPTSPCGSSRCCSASRTSGARVRLVVPVPGGEEAILALPEDFVLASGQRLDVERLAGVLAVRDVALLN